MTVRRLIGAVVAAPLAAVAAAAVGCYRARICGFMTTGRLLALVPGAGGIRLRRYWYRWTLDACGSDVIVDWMAVLKVPGIRLGQRVFIGSFCFIGESDIKDDVMVGHHSSIQGGGHTHGFDVLGVPMAQQPGRIRTITIGPDVWIGTGARVLTDVSPGTVVGAGTVVTAVFPSNAILGGAPARLIRMRGASAEEAGRTPA